MEGRNSWVGLYGISANADSPELALKFIDDKLATLSCSNAMTLFYYGCANQEVMDGVTDPVLIEAFSLDDPSVLETTNFTPNVTEQQRNDWTAMWSRVTAERGPPRVSARPAPDRSRCWDGVGRSASWPSRPTSGWALFFVLPLILVVAISFRSETGPINFENPWQLSLVQYQNIWRPRPTCGCWASRSSWHWPWPPWPRSSPTRLPTS